LSFFLSIPHVTSHVHSKILKFLPLDDMPVASNFYIYILTNLHNNVLYAGSTTDLKKRIYLHRSRLIPGFSKKYNLCKLVYFEAFPNLDSALSRERQLKAGSRAKKIKLIESTGKPWEDMIELIK